jgi:hypothetical protein
MQFLVDNWFFLFAFATLFLANTIVQYKLGYNLGFNEGSVAGFQIGVAHSSLYMSEKQNKEMEFNDPLLTMNQMVNGVPTKNPEYDKKLADLCLKHTLDKYNYHEKF